MFLGFLPAWLGDLSSFLGFPAIVIAILVWVLGRKDANRKLVVEEGTLKKSEFDSFTSAQAKMLDDAQTATADAEAKADKANDRLDIMDDLYDQMRESINWLRAMVKKMSGRSTPYKMTADELAEFDRTRPPPRPPRIRAAAK